MGQIVKNEGALELGEDADGQKPKQVILAALHDELLKLDPEKKGLFKKAPSEEAFRRWDEEEQDLIIGVPELCTPTSLLSLLYFPLPPPPSSSPFPCFLSPVWERDAGASPIGKRHKDKKHPLGMMIFSFKCTVVHLPGRSAAPRDKRAPAVAEARNSTEAKPTGEGLRHASVAKTPLGNEDF